jgi:hypothetical protein
MLRSRRYDNIPLDLLQVRLVQVALEREDRLQEIQSEDLLELLRVDSTSISIMSAGGSSDHIGKYVRLQFLHIPLEGEDGLQEV